jgi:hypothetical protein
VWAKRTAYVFNNKRLKSERLEFQRIKTCSTASQSDIELSLLLDATYTGRMRNDAKSTNHGAGMTGESRAPTAGAKYEVVAGALGSVYCGNSCMRASMAYLKLIEYAKAVQDVVAFFENGQIKRHFIGLNSAGAKMR